MKPRVTGVVVLALAIVLVVVVAIVRGRQVAGTARPIPPPPPPAVGACLSQGRELFDCAAPHRWEVVAAWSADDPRRRAEATTDACEQRADTYSGIATARTVGAWTARVTVVAAVLDAPADQRAGPDRGWTVCAVQPAWVDQRTGSIGGAHSVGDIPDLFGLCLDYIVATGGTDCLGPHDVQVLGSWDDQAAERAMDAGAATLQQLPQDLQTAAARSCLAFASTMTGATDPTYGGRLDYMVVLQQGGNGHSELNCLATPTGGRVLIGSITALGNRSVPLR